jgi:hypothetical protein
MGCVMWSLHISGKCHNNDPNFLLVLALICHLCSVKKHHLHLDTHARVDIWSEKRDKDRTLLQVNIEERRKNEFAGRGKLAFIGENASSS